MRLRFTIRDLLWLTLVVAMAVGWWLDHQPQRYKVIERDILSIGVSQILVDNKTGERRIIGNSIGVANPSPTN